MAQAESKNLGFESWDDDTLDINFDQDITDWTILMEICDNGTSIISKEITSHDNASEGETSIDLTNEDTDNLAGNYDYWLRYKKSGDTDFTTFLKGIIYFAPAGCE